MLSIERSWFSLPSFEPGIHNSTAYSDYYFFVFGELVCCIMFLRRQGGSLRCSYFLIYSFARVSKEDAIVAGSDDGGSFVAFRVCAQCRYCFLIYSIALYFDSCGRKVSGFVDSICNVHFLCYIPSVSALYALLFCSPHFFTIW